MLPWKPPSLLSPKLFLVQFELSLLEQCHHSDHHLHPSIVDSVNPKVHNLLYINGVGRTVLLIHNPPIAVNIKFVCCTGANKLTWMCQLIVFLQLCCAPCLLVIKYNTPPIQLSLAHPITPEGSDPHPCWLFL